MSYTENGGGCCNGGGFSMPFIFPFMAGNGGFGNGNSNGWGGAFGFEALMMLFFFSLFGFGGWGGGWGGMRGGFPGMMPGMSPACGLNAVGGNIAAEAAAYVGQQQVADRVASIATGIDAVAGIATANGVKLEGVKDAQAAGFSALNTHLCEAFNNVSQQFTAQTMQGMNMHNATTALLNDMRAENARCCCEGKYQAAADKCEILGAISASEGRIMAKLDAAEKAALQEKINALQEQKAELKARIDNQNQTAQLLAAIQAQCGPQTPRYGYVPAPVAGCCGNPCLDGLTRAVTDAFGNRISEILFPPTTTPAAA